MGGHPVFLFFFFFFFFSSLPTSNFPLPVGQDLPKRGTQASAVQANKCGWSLLCKVPSEYMEQAAGTLCTYLVGFYNEQQLNTQGLGVVLSKPGILLLLGIKYEYELSRANRAR